MTLYHLVHACALPPVLDALQLRWGKSSQLLYESQSVPQCRRVLTLSPTVNLFIEPEQLVEHSNPLSATLIPHE